MCKSLPTDDKPSLVMFSLEVTDKNIVKEHCANNYRNNFFEQRIAPIWNSLPPSIVDFSSSNRFKLSLYTVNLNIFTRVKLYLLIVIGAV